MVKVTFDEKEQYEEKLDRVVFRANIGDRQLRCVITHKTIEAHFASPGAPHMRTQTCMDMFAKHRTAIHASARRMISEIGENDLEVTSEIVLSPSFM